MTAHFKTVEFEKVLPYQGKQKMVAMIDKRIEQNFCTSVRESFSFKIYQEHIYQISINWNTNNFKIPSTTWFPILFKTYIQIIKVGNYYLIRQII